MQAVLPAAKGGLGVSSARPLFLEAFLAAAVGTKATLSKGFGLKHEDGTYNDALELWFDSATCEVAPENLIQNKMDGAHF